MAFLEGLKSISPPANVPWMLCGDFNMIRYAYEKNNSNFQMAKVEAFNDCINDLCLVEVPLLDRSFTWSNKRSNPTLECLDQVFINLTWDEKLPNTVLSSLTRTTSDHVPLKIDIATSIPKSNIFHFENYWVHAAGFRDDVVAAWSCQTRNSDPATVVAAKLKATRSVCVWESKAQSLTTRD